MTRAARNGRGRRCGSCEQTEAREGQRRDIQKYGFILSEAKDDCLFFSMICCETIPLAYDFVAGWVSEAALGPLFLMLS
jgi:hypothetical protein